jgi:hypothetical protein
LISVVVSLLVQQSALLALAVEAPPWPAMTVQIGNESIQMESVNWTYDPALD